MLPIFSLCFCIHLHTPESMDFYLVRSLISTFDSPRRARMREWLNGMMMRSVSGTLRRYFRLWYTNASTTPPLSAITLQYMQS